jgi:Domain of unknown function (DUF4845)
MRTKQRGVTFLGWLFLLVPFAVVGYAGIRLAPVYLNYMKVARALQQVGDEYKTGDGANPQTIRNSLEKRFDIESVDYPTAKDIKISRDGRVWLVEAAYDDQAPLFANLAILVVFDKTVRIGGE